MDADLERLLLDDLRNLKRQQEHVAGGAAQLYGGTVSLGAHYSLICNQNGINHGGRIVANRGSVVSLASSGGCGPVKGAGLPVGANRKKRRIKAARRISSYGPRF